MISLFLTILLAQQGASSPEALVWSFRQGQDFFVEETQRYLISTQGSTKVTSYVDYSMLWRYYSEKETRNEAVILATLEKIRINNSTEAGGKASEILKQLDNTKSRWRLTRDVSGWKIAAIDNQPRHATPFLLTLGTTTWTDTPASWTQEWQAPADSRLPSKIVLTHVLKEQTSDRTNIRTKAELHAIVESVDRRQTPERTIELHSQPGALQGIGEFDRTRNRWIYYEFWATGRWKIAQGEQRVQVKQDIYCNYRVYEKRPTFP